MYQQPIYGPSILAAGNLIQRMEDYAPGSRSAQWSVDDVRCNRTYKTRIKVEMASQYCGPLNVISLLGVRIGDTYRSPLYASAPTEQDTGSFLQSISVDQETTHGAGGVVQWMVTLEYGPRDIYHDLGVDYIGVGTINPVAKFPEVYWDNAKVEVTRPTDLSSPPLPFLNTAGDPLLDPPSIEMSRSVLKFVRNRPLYDEGQASSFRGCTNADEFLGYPPNTVLCRDIKGERFYDPDWGNYYRVSYEFEINDNSTDTISPDWTKKVLNSGYRYKKAGTGDPINGVDGNNEPTNDIVLLQKNGDKLATGATPIYLPFTLYGQASFSDLDIPEDIFQANL